MVKYLIPVKVLWRWLASLILAASFTFVSASPAAAIGIDDYFSYSYTVAFSQTAITGTEIFYAAIEARAVCNTSLPIAPSEAVVTARIVARHQASGTVVVLNPGYTVTMSPVPSKKGDTANVSQKVPLQFPQGSQPGDYIVVGEFIEAKIKAIVWFSIPDYLPTSQTLGTITFGSTVVGGGSGGASPVTNPPVTAPAPGTTDVSRSVSANGTFTDAVMAKSGDSKATVTVGRGIRGLTPDSHPLNQITIIEVQDRLFPSGNSTLVSSVYNLGPEGSRFDPPVTLAVTYEETMVPTGASKQNLVIAAWNNGTSQWVPLDGGIVDPETNIVTVPVSHFSWFAVLVDSRPANLITGPLTITPTELKVGEPLTINLPVSNIGGLTGRRKIAIKINGAVVLEREMTLVGGGRDVVTLVTSKNEPGTYKVDADGQSVAFTVVPLSLPVPSLAPPNFVISALTISPENPSIGKSLTVSVLVTNTGQISGNHQLTFEIDGSTVATQDVTLAGGASKIVAFIASVTHSGNHTVNIDDLSGTFSVEAPPPVPTESNGTLLAAIAAGGIVLLLAVLVLARRLRA